MSAKPYTAEELAQLRVFASGSETYNANMTARLMANLAAGLLANIDAAEKERDELRLRLAQAEEALDVERAGAMHAQLETDALREAGRALVGILTTTSGGRQCNDCYALATVADPLPRGGFIFHCDKHARAPSDGWEDDPQEPHPTKAAAPLRRLIDLIEVKP